MKFSIFPAVCFILTSLLLFSCGKPPSSGGGPPEGDFPMSVAGAPVTEAPLEVSIELVGSFEAVEVVSLMSEIPGKIVERSQKEGHPVEKGTVLVRLDDRKLKARLQETRSRLSLSESTLRRAETLRESNSVSQQELDEAVAAVDQARASIELLEAEMEDTVLRAPMDGVLGEYAVSPGQVVQAGHVLVELVKLNPIEIRFEVPERYLAALRNGLGVEVSTAAFPDTAFTGKVTYLGPRLLERTRSVVVKAETDNEQGRLKPGMFGRVKLILDEQEEALFVPESAVRQQGDRSEVMVRNEQGRAEVREVRAGVRQAGRIQIVEGLSAGDEVVAEGLIKIGPGVLLNFSEHSRAYGLEPSDAPQPEGD